MLTMLLALAFQTGLVPKTTTELPIPLLWGGEAKVEMPFTLAPRWRVEEVGQSVKLLTSIGVTNLEQWRNLVHTVNIENLAPRKAVAKSKNRSGATSGFWPREHNAHRPWDLAIQQLWYEYECKCEYTEKVLVYDLVKSASINNPNYEAIVCSMPNIRCKAKTIELLEEQLLKGYANYLQTLLDADLESESHPQIRPGNSLDGSFIAWLIRQSSGNDKSNEKLTQIFSFPTPDANQLPWVQ